MIYALTVMPITHSLMASVWRHAHQNTIQSEVNVRNAVFVKSVQLLLILMKSIVLNVILLILNTLTIVLIYVLIHIIKLDLFVNLALIMFAIIVMGP